MHIYWISYSYTYSDINIYKLFKLYFILILLKDFNLKLKLCYVHYIWYKILQSDDYNISKITNSIYFHSIHFDFLLFVYITNQV